MSLWNPVSIVDTRSGSEEQHQCTTGTSLFSTYWFESRSRPQYYNCNFCVREFRSAQALGGHMNVHRRDRALLRFSSNSSSTTFLPPDNILHSIWKPDNSLLGDGVGCLTQQPHSALPASPEKDRSNTASPFFEFIDNSSPSLGLHCQTPYSKEADLYRFRRDVVYSNLFEFNKEDPSPPSRPLPVVGSGGTVDLQRSMKSVADPSQEAPSNCGLDLELRLGNMS